MHNAETFARASGIIDINPARAPIGEHLRVYDAEIQEAASAMIRSISGWRAIFAADGNPESSATSIPAPMQYLASAMALSYTRLLAEKGREGRVLIACDGRPTGPTIADIMIRVFRYLGRGVDFAGIISSPQATALAAADAEISGLCYITASHNPPGYNGVKWTDELGRVLSSRDASRLSDILDSVVTPWEFGENLRRLVVLCPEADVFPVVESQARVIARADAAYRESVTSRAGRGLELSALKPLLAPTSVIADFNGGARGTGIDGELLEELGATLYALHPTPGDIAHSIEPEGTALDECRAELESRLAAGEPVLLGYVADNDGDRGNLVFPLPVGDSGGQPASGRDGPAARSAAQSSSQAAAPSEASSPQAAGPADPGARPSSNPAAPGKQSAAQSPSQPAAPGEASSSGPTGHDKQSAAPVARSTVLESQHGFSLALIAELAWIAARGYTGTGGGTAGDRATAGPGGDAGAAGAGAPRKANGGDAGAAGGADAPPATEAGDTGPAIVVNGATSLRIEEIAARFGVTVFRCEVGEINVVMAAERLRDGGWFVPFAGEGSNGGNITTPGTIRDPISTAISMLRLFAFRSDAESERAFHDLLPGGHPLFLAMRALGRAQQVGSKPHGTGQNPTHAEAFAALDSVLPPWTTTPVTSSKARIEVGAIAHATLKTRLEDLLPEAMSDAYALIEKHGNATPTRWEIRNFEGTECHIGAGSRDPEGDGTGGFAVWFFDASDRPFAFTWMRGSRTEPVFRTLADLRGGSEAGCEALLEWFQTCVRQAAGC